MVHPNPTLLRDVASAWCSERWEGHHIHGMAWTNGWISPEHMGMGKEGMTEKGWGKEPKEALLFILYVLLAHSVLAHSLAINPTQPNPTIYPQLSSLRHQTTITYYYLLTRPPVNRSPTTAPDTSLVPASSP